MKAKEFTSALSIMLLFCFSFEVTILCAQEKSAYQLENPITTSYLKIGRAHV